MILFHFLLVACIYLFTYLLFYFIFKDSLISSDGMGIKGKEAGMLCAILSEFVVNFIVAYSKMDSLITHCKLAKGIRSANVVNIK